jgi:hypothetical protein
MNSVRLKRIICKQCGEHIGDYYNSGYMVGEIMLMATRPLGQFRQPGIKIFKVDVAEHFEKHGLIEIVDARYDVFSQI